MTNNASNDETALSKKRNSTNASTNYIILTPTQYKIFIILTEYGYCASGGEKNVKKTMKYRGHSTVSYHINNLIKYGIIECRNPHEKVKFYRAVSSIKILFGKDKTSLHIHTSQSGRGPNNSVWIKEQKIRRRSRKTGRFIKSRRKKVKHERDYDTIAHQNGQRQKICRVHSRSFIAPITGGPIDKVKWDNVSSPNNRFTQSDIAWYVPGIGYTTFRWIKSKKSELVIFLPEVFLLPYELEVYDKLTEVAWQAAQWFSKNAYRLKRGKKAKQRRIGIGFFVQYQDTHYAFEATKDLKEYFDRHGGVVTDTPSGRAMIDKSKKPFVEQEYTNLDEARRVADSLSLPGQISKVDKRLDPIEDWILKFQEKFSKFLEKDEKKWDLQENRWKKQDRRWDEQMQFNTRFIEMLQCRDEVTTKSFINSKPTGKSDCIDHMYG